MRRCKSMQRLGLESMKKFCNKNYSLERRRNLLGSKLENQDSRKRELSNKGNKRYSLPISPYLLNFLLINTSKQSNNLFTLLKNTTKK